MTDPETPTQPLIRSPSGQTALNGGVPSQGGRSSRAYKVAGLTLLACVLIAGQAMIAYFLLSQRGDIKSLEEQGSKMQAELTKGRSASAPFRVGVPMNSMAYVMDDIEEASAVPQGDDLLPLTSCQMEAAGIQPVQVPGFVPRCDERGLYKALQCFVRSCWCVDPVNGRKIPGAKCGTAVQPGQMAQLVDV